LQPTDADAYCGTGLREAKLSTRTGRSAALAAFFEFLELRHKVELHNLTGRVVESPLDEIGTCLGRSAVAGECYPNLPVAAPPAAR